MILCEARGLQLFWVIRGGIGLTRRLGAGLQHTECLNERLDTLPRTGASQKPIGYHRGMKNLGRSPGFYSMLKLAKGMKPEMARLTLARKIAAITLTLWKKEERFDIEQLKTQAGRHANPRQ